MLSREKHVRGRIEHEIAAGGTATEDDCSDHLPARLARRRFNNYYSSRDSLLLRGTINESIPYGRSALEHLDVFQPRYIRHTVLTLTL